MKAEFQVLHRKRFWPLVLMLGLLAAACNPGQPDAAGTAAVAAQTATVSVSPTVGPTPTPLPERPRYAPGELVDYTAQPGDTLPALAARFNTSVEAILAANPQIPQTATTMPPGMPMQIPIYYQPLWGSPFKILPDSAFVNGPDAIGFDTVAFVAEHPGWLRDYQDYVGGRNRSGAEIVDYVATNFSVNPRLLLALLEYQARALSDQQMPETSYVLGYEDSGYERLYLQLVWAANTLNNGYYGWRSGELTIFDFPDGRQERPDPWLNAASVAIRYYFSRLYGDIRFEQATGPDGLWATYRQLFGDPWPGSEAFIPGSLTQPTMHLPFPAGESWAYTGGPHTGWGTGAPFAAVDFAPPTNVTGCQVAAEPTLAVADGVIVRQDTGLVVLDLDGDGDERTGWTVLYLHISNTVPVGSVLKAGDPVGYPSCEGGRTTGTHVHMARKYNGEWILADGPLAFNLDGWIARNGDRAYSGFLERNGVRVRACECADAASLVRRDGEKP